MSQTVIINGVSYAFPDVDEENWGQTVTNWAVSISTNLLQKTAGTFTLSAEVDFGAAHGVKSLYFKGRTSTPAEAGIIRLAKTDSVSWRNQTNAADVSLALGSGNMIEWAGVELVDLTSTQTMSAKTITGNVTGDLTGDVTGDITGDITGDVTGNASTATALQTARTIGGTSFDGTANISVALSAAATALETARTIGGTSFDGTSNIAVALAAAATALQTARTIGGTSFDGTANIAVALATAATTLETARTIGGTSFDGSSNIAVALASAATALETARTIAMTGDVVWSSGSFDGSGNVTASSALAATQANITSAANLVTVGALDAGSISSGFGAIDNGTSGIESNVITATTNIELDHQGSDPSAPGGENDVVLYAKTKKVYTRDGAGTITELGAGGGAGDADTIQLKTAEASEGTGSAPWYTGQDTVPGSDQGTLGGTWELSTSNPLINTNDATKVFHYSNATSDRKGDYFEIELDVPNYAKGHNLVVQLFYRTVGAEDTDFLFFARDRTGDYETTFTTEGTTVNAFVVSSATGFAVGDRICFEDSSNARHFRYVTAVPDGTHVTFSGAAAAFDDNAAVVTKFFTDELDFITAENNTTNYEGKIRKWAFQINETTTKIRVGFLYDNSATSTNELFFDQILLSSNQFLQVSSQGQTEEYIAQGWNATDSTNRYVPYIAGPVQKNTISKTGTVTNSSTYGWYFTANQKVRVDIGGVISDTSGTGYIGIVKVPDVTSLPNGTGATTAAIYDGGWDAYRMGPATYIGHASQGKENSFSFIAEKGEDVLFLTAYESAIATGNYQGGVTMAVTPQVNDVVLLNSQDEIFTDWVDAGALVIATTGSAAVKGSIRPIDKMLWRRVGSNMEVRMDYHQTNGGTAGSGDYLFSIPSGYSIDTSKVEVFSTVVGRSVANVPNIVGVATADGVGLGYSMPTGVVSVYSSTQIRVYGNEYGIPGRGMISYDVEPLSGANQSYSFKFSVPIAGWTSTFNPVLSMPLVDYSSLDNVFSAVIQSDATIRTQGGNWLASVTNPTTGEYNLTFTSGFFSAAPAVVVTPLDNGGNQGSAYYATTTSGTEAWFTISNTGANANYEFSVTVTRQGADWRQQPQPTAAVIKPAVCLLKYVLANNTGGDQAATPGSWHIRALNTTEGESWFLDSFASNLFTLQKGTYELEAAGSFINTNESEIALYNNTDSVFTDYGIPVYVSVSYSDNVSALLSTTFTITSSKAFYLKYRTSHDNGLTDLGNPANFGNIETYTIVKIRKLK